LQTSLVAVASHLHDFAAVFHDELVENLLLRLYFKLLAELADLAFVICLAPYDVEL
jgi:hypothetical protein